mgnify:CR=1 FL=1
MAFVKPDLSEPQRMILGQRKIVCARGGCSLMGLAKNALDTASVPEKHNRLGATDNTRQLTLTARMWGGLNAVDDTG